MAERPILFSAPMVRALLSGAKSQTRRIVKFVQGAFECRCEFPRWRSAGAGDWHCGTCGGGVRGVRANFQGLACPHGVPGDLLWVRETWGMNHYDYALGPTPKARPVDLTDDYLAHRATEDDPEILHELRWRPSIHMPRWASRITLRITDVRVERLQDISEADAIAEGLYRSKPDDEDRAWFKDWTEDQTGAPPTDAEMAQFEEGVWMAPGAPQGWGLTKAERRRDRWAPTPQFAYRLVWEAINGPASWDANPWVWAVSFERVQP